MRVGYANMRVLGHSLQKSKQKTIPHRDQNQMQLPQQKVHLSHQSMGRLHHTEIHPIE